MCLMIASSNYNARFATGFGTLQPKSSVAPAPNKKIINGAIRAFFKYGGHPHVVQPSTYGYQVPTTAYSNSFQGFALYLARLLRPLWNENVTIRSTEMRGDKDVQVSTKFRKTRRDNSHRTEIHE